MSFETIREPLRRKLEFEFAERGRVVDEAVKAILSLHSARQTIQSSMYYRDRVEHAKDELRARADILLRILQEIADAYAVKWDDAFVVEAVRVLVNQLDVHHSRVHGIMSQGPKVTLQNQALAGDGPGELAEVRDRHRERIANEIDLMAVKARTSQDHGVRSRFAPVHSAAVTEQLASRADVIDFDTVTRDLDRALTSADEDPEDAITAACSVVESVCRSVLVALSQPLPAKRDLQGLYRAVRDPLGLSPEQTNLPAEVAHDIRKMLSGLVTTLEGIAALRTHAGDAHGRERGFARADGRIARLAIHGASTAALFVIETWQQKFPAKELRRQ